MKVWCVLICVCEGVCKMYACGCVQREIELSQNKRQSLIIPPGQARGSHRDKSISRSHNEMKTKFDINKKS